MLEIEGKMSRSSGRQRDLVCLKSKARGLSAVRMESIVSFWARHNLGERGY